MDIWIYGYHGRMDIWIYGSMDIWIFVIFYTFIFFKEIARRYIDI